LDKRVKAAARRLPTQRRLVQLYAALLYNAHIRGFISGEIYTGSGKLLCVPGLNCYSCPGAVGACPLGALQNAISASGHRAPYYILGILLLWGVLLGRTICGWLCPMGLLQELVHKLPVPKLKKSAFTRALSWLKYVIFGLFVVVIPLYYALRRLPLPAFCKYICPAGTLEGAVALLANRANEDLFPMLGGLFTWKFLLLIGIIAACLFVYRAFCRFLCPLGAIYGLFSRVAVVGVKVEKDKCVSCGRCVGCCPVDIRRVGDRECVSCGKCVEECPSGAISIKAGKAVLMGKRDSDEKSSRSLRIRAAAWVLALAVLAGVLWAANRGEKTEESTPPAVETPAGSEGSEENGPDMGYEPGMTAPDFSVALIGGDEFSLREQRGKTVVLNFWATWCTPCVEELPYFDELHRNYGENVAVIALHSHLVTEDVEAYLENFDYAMHFAVDESGDIIRAFGGSTTLPQTVVIDPEGVVTYNELGSVSYEKLYSLVFE